MHTHATPLRLTILAAAIAASVSAHAQEVTKPAKPAAQEQKVEDAKLQKVEVHGTAEAYDPRRDDTASKVVVNHDEIVKYGDTNVLDTLKRVPGVTVVNGGIRMRGLGSGYTQILINGERAPAGFSMDSLSPDVIERIEVLRAASAEYSTQSVAGTINIVLKKAIKNAQREVKVGVGHSTNYTNPAVNLQLSDRADKLSWSLPANVMYMDNERDAPIVEQAFDPAGQETLHRSTASHFKNHFSAINVSPRLNWNLGGGDTLTWQTFVNVNRFGGGYDLSMVTDLGHPPPTPNIQQHIKNENEFFRTDVEWVQKLASGSRLQMKVGGLVGGLGNTLRRLGYTGAARTLDSVIESKGTDHGLSSTGKYTNPLVEGHSLALGWDAGYNTRDDSRVEATPIIEGTGVDATPAMSRYLDEKFKSRITRLAVYTQDEWNVTPRWSVYLGARWEGIQTRTSGASWVGGDRQPGDGFAARSRSSVWSPLMQTLYKLPGTKADQVRFAVTRTYKAPDLQSLIPRRFPSANNNSTNPDFMGNPNLKPELALGLDASYEHYFAEGGLLSISASSRKITDFTRVMVVQQGDLWVALPSNTGNARTHGLELEAKFPLKVVYANAPAIDLRASVSRNWSTVDSIPGPNNRLDQQTPLSATFGVDYKAGALTTGASFAFRNGGPVRISQAQTNYQTVRRDLDMYALWKFNPKVQLRVALSNVLGQDWISSSSYAEKEQLMTRTTVSPAYMVTRATLEMKF
jgi:outer membrane receptor protein involved in Fe transport